MTSAFIIVLLDGPGPALAAMGSKGFEEMMTGRHRRGVINKLPATTWSRWAGRA